MNDRQETDPTNDTSMHADPTDGELELAAAIAGHSRERFERFVPTSIADLFSDSEEFLTLSPPLVDLLTTRRRQTHRLLGEWLRAMDSGRVPAYVRLLSHNAGRFLKNNNQFLTLDDAARRELDELYRRFIELFHDLLDRAGDVAIREGAVDAIARHRDNLRGFVRSLDLPAGAFEGRAGTPCSEYSAHLQTTLLGLDPAGIHGPVLDLGCGERGHLVHHLHRLGLQAVGVDAYAPEDDALLIRGDWLAVPLGRERWGTIVSHMAFSNHFLHHHLKGSSEIVEYARRYMAILDALRPGGRFVYTPGLPFIEDLLPRERYHVEVRPIAGAGGTEVERRIARLAGRSTFYAATVTKKPA